jgi:phosphopantothenate synthetase
VKRQHGLVVIHIDLNLISRSAESAYLLHISSQLYQTHLLLRLVVSNTEAVPDLNLGSIVAPHTKQSADDTLLVHVPPQRVIQDRKESLIPRHISILPH